MINEQQELILSLMGIAFILFTFAWRIRKMDDAEKEPEVKFNDLIHLELLRTMPSICTNQFRMGGRSETDNVCDVIVSGEYQKLIFCVKFQVSDAMGENRVVSVVKEDKNHMSFLLDKNFKESMVIANHIEDTLIKRIGRKISGK